MNHLIQLLMAKLWGGMRLLDSDLGLCDLTSSDLTSSDLGSSNLGSSNLGSSDVGSSECASSSVECCSPEGTDCMESCLCIEDGESSKRRAAAKANVVRKTLGPEEVSSEDLREIPPGETIEEE